MQRVELLRLALGTDVHHDAIAAVADPPLGAPARVHLEVGCVERTVGLEDDLTEAERVALSVGAGVGGVEADDLRAVLDVDVDAVLAETALTVRDGRVAGQRHRRNVGVPGDGDGLELTGFTGVAAVADRTLGSPKDLVLVGGTDVDLPTVVVAHQRLEVVVLPTGGPAVADADRVGVLLERDPAALLERDLAGAGCRRGDGHGRGFPGGYRGGLLGLFEK